MYGLSLIKRIGVFPWCENSGLTKVKAAIHNKPERIALISKCMYERKSIIGMNAPSVYNGWEVSIKTDDTPKKYTAKVIGFNCANVYEKLFLKISLP